jgi:hypothetical protein
VPRRCRMGAALQGFLGSRASPAFLVAAQVQATRQATRPAASKLCLQNPPRYQAAVAAKDGVATLRVSWVSWVLLAAGLLLSCRLLLDTVGIAC